MNDCDHVTLVEKVGFLPAFREAVLDINDCARVGCHDGSVLRYCEVDCISTVGAFMCRNFAAGGLSDDALHPVGKRDSIKYGWVGGQEDVSEPVTVSCIELVPLANLGSKDTSNLPRGVGRDDLNEWPVPVGRNIASFDLGR